MYKSIYKNTCLRNELHFAKFKEDLESIFIISLQLVQRENMGSSHLLCDFSIILEWLEFDAWQAEKI